MIPNCAAALLLACVAFLVPPSRAVTNPSTTTDLLWPLPTKAVFGSSVFTIQQSSFHFVGEGAGGSSDILKEAFQRYIQLIFETPVPFYPTPSAGPVGLLSVATVEVKSSNETLGPDTNEACKLFLKAFGSHYASKMQFFVCR